MLCITMADSDSLISLYRRSARTSFFLVIFLVFVGGIVRSTGAGMGCPDWPKCFGKWVPPTKASEVPFSYYSDPLSSRDGHLIFNPIKTWTEYVNRLLGVLIGISVIIQLIMAFRCKVPSVSKLMSLLAFVLVCFQGWLGAKVVSSDLRPFVITTHLVVALLIGLALVIGLSFSNPTTYKVFSFENRNLSSALLYVGLSMLLVQFFLGTEVRSQVDEFFKIYDYGNRGLYLGQFDWWFYVHRTFSLVVLFVLGFQIFRFGRFVQIQFFWIVVSPFLLGVGMALSGVTLVYFDFPAFVQPVHLFLGFVIVCAQLQLLLTVRSIKLFARGNS